MIKAAIIQHSKCATTGKEIITWELEYPRFTHSEMMTHRMFSRNAASSRAIPVAKMIEQVRDNPAMPVHWGKNQPGMQAKEELHGQELYNVQLAWTDAAEAARSGAEYMASNSAHKQIVNRILEPFQWMKTVVTYTEGENFFWLRNHEDAQPEIKALAEAMLRVLKDSKPFELNAGEWHVPYVERSRMEDGSICYSTFSGGCIAKLTVEEALKISSSCCAQVSYRLLDQSLEKALIIYDRLVESEPVHASPFEHQASPMHRPYNEFWHNQEEPWEEGVTHVDRGGNFWSGNFCGYIQHRQLIPNNVVEG